MKKFKEINAGEFHKAMLKTLREVQNTIRKAVDEQLEAGIPDDKVFASMPVDTHRGKGKTYWGVGNWFKDKNTFTKIFCKKLNIPFKELQNPENAKDFMYLFRDLVSMRICYVEKDWFHCFHNGIELPRESWRKKK